MKKIIYELKEVKQDGTIIYNKKIIDENLYDVAMNNDELILKPKPIQIKIKKLDDFDKNLENFRGSRILDCFIDGKRPFDNNYSCILKDIYKIIGKGKIIAKQTLLNFETIEKKDKGFEFLENLGISIQRKESLYMFEEILNQCIKSGIKIKIEIKFLSGKIIHYSV